MEAIVSNLQSLSSHFIPMVVLLGLLIFVHELGHFLVAKYYKVRVEVFSLGFGPKIFKFKRGDTTYAISAIPLGGYVKMFGDDPTADVQDDQKSYSFTHKPVGQRIAVVLAGPLMNFFFAILVFMMVAFIGENTFTPKLGDVEPNTVAAQAGFQSGDTVLSVNSKAITSWEELQKAVEANGNQTMQFEVKREATGATEKISATPKVVKNKNVLSWDRVVGEVEGLTIFARSSIVGVMSPDTVAGKAGLKTGDQITEINGTKIDKWRSLMAEAPKALASSDKLTLTVTNISPEGREGAPRTIEIAIPAKTKSMGAVAGLKELGIEMPELYVSRLEKDSPAEKAGMLVGDKLVTIDGQSVASFDEVSKIIRNHPSEEKTLQISLIRDGKPLDISVAPNLNTRMTNQGKEEKRFEIGISPMVINAIPAYFETKASGPIEALTRGFNQTIRWTSLTILSFVRLFQAEVSAKNIGGFLSIGQMAKRSWQDGLAPFLVMMGIISINLFILNLLPVPVLDGGHLVFFGIEAIRGAPLSLRKLEIAQQVGLILLLGLMVFALFNDIQRIFFRLG